ncbi:response regulator transcription factor [Thalassobaculum salexigens]|uniref:response regulator transcription factor n=1 Tax=Thalassobaculum salexigens TaxID=455360 RepID=UPI00248F371D|nr:response regulator [Thalassobaculum salexigens]
MNPGEEHTVPAHVLIAEDEPNIVESLSFILSREGCEVTAVFDGRAVIDKIGTMRPDLVILDVMLPKMNGFEVLKWIKSNPDLKGVPVMILTAKGQDKDRKTAEELGADAFVTKPFSNREVVERVMTLASA